MPHSLRRRIVNKILFAPSVVLPIVGGLSALLASWAASGVTSLNMIGLLGVAGGLGWLSTRLIFGVEKIAESIVADEQADSLRQQEERLVQIRKKLRYDRDPRTDDYFTLLKQARDDFDRMAEESAVIVRSLELQPKVKKLFWAAIDRLDDSHEAHTLAEKLFGSERDAVLARREAMLVEVKTTLDQLQHAVAQLRELSSNASDTDLSALRDELDESLRIAAKTEQRMRELEGEVTRKDFLKE